MLLDGFDRDHGVRLAVANVTAITSLSLVLNNGNLVSAGVFKHLCCHHASSNSWRTNLYRSTVSVCYKQWLESHRRTRFKFYPFYSELLPLGNEVLLATASNNCVHKRLCWAGGTEIRALVNRLTSQKCAEIVPESPRTVNYFSGFSVRFANK